MALQHLRSATANKRPTPGSMSDGQVAMNTNLASPGLFFKDSNGDLVKVGPVHVGTTAPNASPASGGQAGNSKGEQWLDTSSSRYVFKIWDGTAWRTEDGEFVNASGDLMTGALGIIAGTVSAPGVYFSGDTNTGLWSPGADSLALSTNGTQRLTIDSTGKALLGGSTARAVGGAVVPQLAVETTGQAASLVRNSADTSGGILALGKSRGTALGDVTAVINGDILGEIRFAGANGTDLTSIGAHIRAVVDGEVGTAGDTTDMPTQLTFSTTPNGEATATQRMVIDSSGRLLVGTSTARTSASHTGSLQLEGTSFSTATASIITNANDSTGAYLHLGKARGGSIGNTTVVQSGDTLGQIHFTGSDGTNLINGAWVSAVVDGTPGANDLPTRLVFSTTADGASSPTERMRINSNGSADIYSIGDPVLGARSSRGAGTTDTLFAGYYSATSTSTGTLSFRVYTNGNVQNTNNSYGAISDLKLKENIVDANSQWDDLKALQVRNYNFKEGQTHTQIGLIAQEAELVSPGLVSESPDRDADGNDLGTVTKAVNYSVLYMKAVKALQEAMERIETLEAKVAALEAS